MKNILTFLLMVLFALPLSAAQTHPGGTNGSVQANVNDAFGVATSGNIASTVQSATGCSTAGQVWAPATNTCVTATGGSVSGQTANTLPLATGSAVIGATSGITQSGTTPNFTYTFPFNLLTTNTSEGSAAGDSATLGSELTSSGNCSASGWTGSYNSYTNGASNTGAITCSLTGLTNNGIYQIAITASGVTAGSISNTFSGTTLSQGVLVSGVTYYSTAATGTSASLVVTPTAAYNGTVSVSVKKINPITSAAPFTGFDSTDATSFSAWAPAAASKNFFIGTGGKFAVPSGATDQSYDYFNDGEGIGALDSLTLGSYNHGGGNYTLHFLTTGFRNTADGNEACEFLTTGSANVCDGQGAGWLGTAASNNVSIGNDTGLSNLTGNNIVAVGQNALYYNTVSNNTAVGRFAGRGNATGSNGVFIGEGAGYGAGNAAPFTVLISAQTPGSGYSGSWTCTVNGGIFTSQATCTATVSSGGLVFAITSAGSYQTQPTSITFTGGTFTPGTAATVTAALNLNNTQSSSGSNDTFVGALTTLGSAVQVTNSTALGEAATVTNSNEVTLGNNSVTQVNAGGEGAVATLNAATLSGSSLNINAITAAPAAPTGTPSTSGGSIQTDTTYIVIYGVNCAGQAGPSGTISAPVSTTGPTASIAWTWPAIAGVCTVPGLAEYRVGLCATSQHSCGTLANMSWNTTVQTNSFNQILNAFNEGGGGNPTTNQTGIATIGGAFKFAGGQAFTGVQGTTGLNLAAANGSFTAGDIVTTDANGNFSDSGLAATGNIIYSYNTCGATCGTSGSPLTASLGSQTMVSSVGGNGALYLFSGSISQVSVGTSCATSTASLTLSWFDIDNSVNYAPGVPLIANNGSSASGNTTATFSTSSVGSSQANVFRFSQYINAKAGDPIRFSVGYVATGCSPNWSYVIRPTLTLISQY